MLLYFYFIFYLLFYVFFFFFSSRRRHTRCSRDWSSDVCSSDLANARRFVATDSFPVTAPLREGSLVLPPVADYLKPVGGPGDEARRRWRGGEVEENECETLGFVAQDTLLRLGDGRPAALRLAARGGGGGGGRGLHPGGAAGDVPHRAGRTTPG